MAEQQKPTGSSSLSNFNQKIYADFSGGLNDTASEISIDDNQTVLSENVDYSVQSKAIKTRKGCEKSNRSSFRTDVTDGYAWMIGSVKKKCIVMNGKVYDMNTELGVATEKIELTEGATRIYPFTMYNTLYFGDGSELYQWGVFDHSTDVKDITIKKGDIVKCNESETGVRGHFYKYLKETAGQKVSDDDVGTVLSLPFSESDVENNVDLFAHYEIGGLKLPRKYSRSALEDLDTDQYIEMDDYNKSDMTAFTVKAGQYLYYKESRNAYKFTTVTYQYDLDGELGIRYNLDEADFSDETTWEDVTDVVGFSSNVVRSVKPHDASEAEVVEITVFRANTEAGTITLRLDGVEETVELYATVDIKTIVIAIASLKFDGWKSEIVDHNIVRFTSLEKKEREVGYISSGTSGASIAYNTIIEGKSDDNDMSPIKKCTIFCVHEGSSRVFAAGNPEDPGLYYSEIGYGNYFKSQINKIYPSTNGFGVVTGMCNLSFSLLVSYENGWYAWKGVTPLTDASWASVNIPYGCVNHRTICATPQSFTFLARDGIYNVSVAILNDSYILLQTKQVIKKISEDSVDNTLRSFKNLDLCSAVFYDNFYMIAYSTNGTYCDRILKYEWDTASFTIGTGWIVNAWMNDHDRLFFASRNYVMEAFTGEHDIDVLTGEPKAIEFHIKSKEYYLDSPQVTKVLQHISFIFQQNDKLTSGVKIIIHAGYKKKAIRFEDLAESLYWSRAFGSTVWGYKDSIVRSIETVLVSNTFQIEVINDRIDDPITMIGIGFVYEDTDFITPSTFKDEELMI